MGSDECKSIIAFSRSSQDWPPGSHSHLDFLGFSAFPWRGFGGPQCGCLGDHQVDMLPKWVAMNVCTSLHADGSLVWRCVCVGACVGEWDAKQQDGCQPCIGYYKRLGVAEPCLCLLHPKRHKPLPCKYVSRVAKNAAFLRLRWKATKRVNPCVHRFTLPGASGFVRGRLNVLGSE